MALYIVRYANFDYLLVEGSYKQEEVNEVEEFYFIYKQYSY